MNKLLAITLYLSISCLTLGGCATTNQTASSTDINSVNATSVSTTNDNTNYQQMIRMQAQRANQAAAARSIDSVHFGGGGRR